MSGSAKKLPFSDIGKYIQLLGLLLALGVVGSSYMKKEGGDAHSAAQSSGDSKNSPAGSSRPERLIAALEGKSTVSLAEQIRPAIVSVKTSWGSGSGFFIRKNFIITCKHVVEHDLEKLAALRKQVRRNRQLLGLEEEKLSSYRARLNQMGTGSSKNELKILMNEREKHFADFRFRQEKDELDLAEQKKALEHPAIKIVLADGSEQSGSLVRMSQDYDLALLTLASVQNSPVLDPSPSGAFLRLGDPVFVSGSSPDPEKRVTTGIFSGYRRIGMQNQMFLQIDTEVLLDKSGGPVLDAAGYVRGIVTRAVQDGKAIGFAIPIERVFDEFPAVLQ
ncbi:trypsin-like peptidase domain-containing protein [Desulfobulbus sp. US1]|nr:trypsin-like peptidase domain-containing protein [Desulfobulbus sp. US4]MCW5207731.1 trypsin-like peptidase domain-containing protein [Desulfobulbus sp. US2]MCW5209581.1 trypsin-like peptidase domain-containing protein [Desulfobulbus sp. US1]MCW5210900.1 trypsin-like peptidase domain-containing protein [Desulfobulbus sp. N3]